MAYPFPLRDLMSASQFPALSGDELASNSVQAERALRGMRRSLSRWLKSRRTMDAYVAGQRKAASFLRNPGSRPLPPAVAALGLRQSRLPVEQDLADTIHALLTEAGFDAGTLPAPTVAVDPDAAVKLAEIAIAGRAPTETAVPSAQGFIWLIAIPVAGAVLIISQLIQSKADVAKEKEHLACVRAGACTDSGFWLKIAAMGVIGWIAWDKLGLREAAAGARRRVTERTK